METDKPRAWLAGPIATCAGLGAIPGAPGTAGSLASLGLAALLVEQLGWGAGHFAFLTVAALPPAIWAAHEIEAASGEKDPRRIVVDEVVGQWTALVGVTVFNWKSWLAAFLLFRLFDIWKPFPVRRLEGLPGGFGIVADDVAAGLYAALVLFTAGWFNLY